MSPFEEAASTEGGAEAMLVLAQADAHVYTEPDKLVCLSIYQIVAFMFSICSAVVCQL